MKLFTKEILTKLTKAGYNNNVPICKLFCPWNGCTWLITGIEDGILYGIADLNMQCVESGGISSIQEMETIIGPFGLKVERDLYWSNKKKSDGTEWTTCDYTALDTLSGI